MKALALSQTQTDAKTDLQAYYMVVAYIVAPFFAFCNAYGMGLTDWNMVTT